MKNLTITTLILSMVVATVSHAETEAERKKREASQGSSQPRQETEAERAARKAKEAEMARRSQERANQGDKKEDKGGKVGSPALKVCAANIIASSNEAVAATGEKGTLSTAILGQKKINVNGSVVIQSKVSVKALDGNEKVSLYYVSVLSSSDGECITKDVELLTKDTKQ